MLDHPFLSLDAYQITFDVVVYREIVKVAVVLAVKFADFLEFLLEALADKRSHVEIESWNCLSSVHLVLDGLHGDTPQDTGGLYPFCRT